MDFTLLLVSVFVFLAAWTYSKREGAVLRGILVTATEHGVVRVALNDQLEPLVGRRIPLNDYTSEVPRSQTTPS
jgi:hypothetical protein